MNKIKLFMAALACLAVGAACSDDDKVNLNVDKSEMPLGYEAQECEINLETEGNWTAESSDAWCKLYKTSSNGDAKLYVRVQGNLLPESRTARITLKTDDETKVVTLTQEGKPEGVEYKYRLPIIFHVIYNDASDSKQNIPAGTINEILREVNDIYKNSGTDMNLEFMAATRDPRGNLLEEPGIDRIQWVTKTLDADDVMTNTTRKYVHFMWDPDEYVNIFLYTFSDPYTTGISTMPLNPLPYIMDGVTAVPNYDYTFDNLYEVRGVSLNNRFINDPSDKLSKYAPAEWKNIIDRQNSPAVTLAHELGHFLGLLHTFTTDFYCSDTDYCKDTPTYMYDTYAKRLLDLYERIDADPDFVQYIAWADLFNRSNCSNEDFAEHNMMDYAYSYFDTFTPAQKERVQHTLMYSIYIPGPKLNKIPLEEDDETATASKARKPNGAGLPLVIAKDRLPYAPR